MRLRAVIFDVDGTLAETEEAHRRAFNETFARFGLDWTWGRDLYRDLLQVTGGKERIRHFATGRGLGAAGLPDARISAMHAAKTDCYARLVAAGECRLRPGVETMIRGARARGLRLAIATTTSRPNVDALLEAALGTDAARSFDVIVAGDEVPRKKPAPDVYLEVLDRLQLDGRACLAIEDSRNGLVSAREAGIPVWITPSLYTAHESFAGADRVLTDLSDFDRLVDGLMPTCAPFSRSAAEGSRD